MNLKFAIFVSATLILLFLNACFSDNSAKEKETEQETQQNTRDTDKDSEINIDIDSDDIDLSGLKESIDKLEEKLNDWNDGKKVEIVDYKDLKKILPSRIAWMNRSDLTGEKVGALGFKMARAQATYGDKEKGLEVSIIDFAGFGGAVNTMAAWSLVDIERESDDGYERRTTFDGHEAFETYDRTTKDGEINILVHDRFIVNIKGWNVSERDLTKARKSIDLDDLEDLI